MLQIILATYDPQQNWQPVCFLQYFGDLAICTWHMVCFSLVLAPKVVLDSPWPISLGLQVGYARPTQGCSKHTFPSRSRVPCIFAVMCVLCVVCSVFSLVDFNLDDIVSVSITLFALAVSMSNLDDNCLHVNIQFGWQLSVVYIVRWLRIALQLSVAQSPRKVSMQLIISATAV